MVTSGDAYATKIRDDSDSENASYTRFKKIRNNVKENLLKNYNSSKKRYDLRARPIHYNVGDIVWKVNTVQSSAEKKIISKFLGNVKCKVQKRSELVVMN